MKRPSDRPPSEDQLREKLIGLGESSTRKSYYPQLLRQLDELEQQRKELEEKNRVMLEILQDLDRQRKRARASEAKLSKIFRASSQLIAVLSIADGRFIEISDSWINFLSRQREEIIGSTPIELGLWANAEDWMGILQTLQREGDLHGLEVCLCPPSGEAFYGLLSMTTIELDENPCMVLEITDITARKRAEEEQLEMERRLLHTQKLESLGVLAGGIAHDFNNLLMAMEGNLELALMDLPGDSAVNHRLHQAVLASRRAADLVKQILAYSGKGQFMFTRVDVNHLIQQSIELLKAAMLRSVPLHIDSPPDLPPIEADAGQVQQVIMNLLTNAAEAVGDGAGTVTLTTGWRECDSRLLSQSRLIEKPEPGPFLFIEVKDNGSGMDKVTLARLFEPFYTTKFTGRGLGMSVVLGIVRKHKGAVLVDSEPGRGTTVRVLLPLSESPGAAPLVKPWEWDSTLRQVGLDPLSGTVLVVDDEEFVLEVCQSLVEHMGFSVYTAVDGEDGLAVFREHSEEIDCVILDLTMPRMDGLSAFQEIKRNRPETPVILSSGYSQYEATQRFAGMGLSGFIQKPYTLQTLKDTILGALESRIGVSSRSQRDSA